MASEMSSGEKGEGNQLGYPNSNPHLPQHRAPKLTAEEIKILEECNSESFWYRCVPMAVVMGGATTFFVKAGYLKAHPRFGGTLKTLGAMSLAYILGKISYQSTCQQKILDKIPDSNLAQSVRKTKGLVPIGESEVTYDHGMQFAPESAEPAASDKLKEVYSSSDFSSEDSSRNMQELDDRLRPTLDRDVKEKQIEQPPEAPPTLTYEELRLQNRLEYERNMASSPRSPFRQRPFPASGPPSSESSTPDPSVAMPGPMRRPERGPSKKNEYGDVWDD